MIDLGTGTAANLRFLSPLLGDAQTWELIDRDQALLDAIQRKEIDPDDAFRFANEKKKFARFVTDTEMVPMVDVGGNEKLLNG